MSFTPSEIEDGTGKHGAIVYGRTLDPVAEAVAYLSRRGKAKLATLTGTVGGVSKQEISLLRGTEHIERIARVIAQGSTAFWNQGMVFPRRGISAAGYYVPWEIVDSADAFLLPNLLPEDYLRACWEAAELHAGGDPLNEVIDDASRIKKERLGSNTNGLETEYFYPGKTKIRAYPVLMDLIRPFMSQIGRLERG